MEAHFIVVQTNGKPKKFKLSDNEYVVIGRSPKLCQVKLDDDLCSSRHCRVSITKGSVIIEDLKSKNGVYLNGVRILKQKLYINDKVKFGHTTLYINPKRMDPKDVEKYTYKGQTEIRGVGNLTLELDGIKTAKSSDNSPNQALPQIQLLKKTKALSRQRANAARPKNTTAPLSRRKLALLKYFSSLIDVTIAVALLYSLITLTKRMNPKLAALARENNEMKFLFLDEVLPYLGACLFVTFLFHRINRKFRPSSLGEKLLGVTKDIFQ